MSAVLGWLLPLQGVAAAVLLVALLGTAVMRGRPAETRRAVWATAFAMVLALPLLRLTLEPARLTISNTPSAIIVMTWLLGAAALMLRQAMGLRASTIQCRRARPIADGPWRATAREVSAEPPELRLAQADSPAVAGVLNPMVLIPRRMEHLDSKARRAVLTHEFAHVARGDTAVLLVAGAVRALYWPNPLVWLGHRALRRAMEHAADDAVLESGVPSSTYAAQLVATARAQLDRAGTVAARGLRPRVEAILDRSRRRSRLRSPKRFAVRRLAVTAIVFASLVTACEATSHGAEPNETHPGATGHAGVESQSRDPGRLD